MHFNHIAYDNDEELIEILHNATMNAKNASEARTARCLKQILPIILRWSSEEAERGVHPYEIYSSFVSAFITALSSLVATKYRKDEAAEVIYNSLDKLMYELFHVALEFKKDSAPENVGKT